MNAVPATPHRPRFLFPERLTEAPVRLVAGGVSLGIAGAFLLQAGWVLPLLAAGFVLRVAAGPRFSPLARLAIAATRAFDLPRRSIPGAPKQFAAAIGAVVLTLASALHLAGWPGAAWAVAGMVAALAGLEAVLAYCLGCKIYEELFGCAECAGAVRHQENLTQNPFDPH
jgi:hypothetical protein